MSDLVKRFRARVRREMGEAVGRGQRYPAELRLLAVRYWEQVQGEGSSLSAAASALGVRRWTLQRWVGAEEPGFRPVALVDDVVVDQAITVVLPQGVRVECASVEVAAALLRALR
jgi:hypothetical protein